MNSNCIWKSIQTFLFFRILDCYVAVIQSSTSPDCRERHSAACKKIGKGILDLAIPENFDEYCKSLQEMKAVYLKDVPPDYPSLLRLQAGKEFAFDNGGLFLPVSEHDAKYESLFVCTMFPAYYPRFFLGSLDELDFVHMSGLKSWQICFRKKIVWRPSRSMLNPFVTQKDVYENAEHDAYQAIVDGRTLDKTKLLDFFNRLLE